MKAKTLNKALALVFAMIMVLGTVLFISQTARAEDASIIIKTVINKTDYTVNGEAKTTDVAPMLKDGRTMVPVRFIAEAFGADVKWEPTTETVTVNFNGDVVTLVIGKADPAAGMDVAPILHNGRTMVPLRYIAEVFGADVKWDGPTETVTITYTAGGTAEVPVATADAPKATDAPTAAGGTLKVGSIIVLGTNKEFRDTPIEWQVMEIKGNEATLMSKFTLGAPRRYGYRIAKEQFDDLSLIPGCHESIHFYANEIFYKNSFTDAEKAVIVPSYSNVPEDLPVFPEACTYKYNAFESWIALYGTDGPNAKFTPFKQITVPSVAELTKWLGESKGNEEKYKTTQDRADGTSSGYHTRTILLHPQNQCDPMDWNQPVRFPEPHVPVNKVVSTGGKINTAWNLSGGTNANGFRPVMKIYIDKYKELAK